MKNAEHPILSISLLVSDRLDTIPRCLESLTLIRETIPTELIIIDTSNNPKVHECALKYTDKVEKFEWCNDFAKARNAGLNKAKGEWFMFIDDDEWFLENDALIEFFRTGEYRDYGYAYYRVRNYLDEHFETYSDSWAKRLVKIQPNTKFYSKIHEYLVPSEGKSKLLDVTVGHTGYIFKTYHERLKHFERNATLLRRMEVEEPQNLHWKLQLIQEYCSVGEWESLEIYCKKIIKESKTEFDSVDAFKFLQIYLGYMIALGNVNKYDEAKEIYKSCKDLLEQTLFIKATMEYCMASICFKLKEFKEVQQHVKTYLDGLDKYQKNSKEYEKEVVEIYIEVPFASTIQVRMQIMLLTAELELGNYKAIYEIYPKLKWDGKNQKLYFNVHIKLIEALIFLQDDDMLKMVLQDGLSCETVKPHLIKTILAWKQKDEGAFIRLLNIVKSIDVWEWYTLYTDVLKMCKMVSYDEVRKYAILFINETPNIFQVPNTIRTALQKNGIELEELYTEVEFIKWKEHLLEHFNCMKMKQLDELKNCLEKSSVNGDIRFGYFMMLYSEQKLLQSANTEVNMDEYSNLLDAFSTYTCKTYEALYGDNIQNFKMEELPNNYQAALWLQIYFEEVGKNLKVAITCLGRVAEAYPFLQECIKFYLYLIQKEMF